MYVETSYNLVTNGQYVEHGCLIYDKKDGQFVGQFLGFTGGNIVLKFDPRTCNDSNQISDFPVECVEGWTLEPLPTKPPVNWPESLRRFFRAAHKSDDQKQIALALNAVDRWTREEILGEPADVLLDDIPF